MKKYGIYLFYPWNADLRADGLSLYLAEFLKAAEKQPSTKFVIACPSWMRANLSRLIGEAGISPNAFEIIGPQQEPPLLKLYRTYSALKRRSSRGIRGPRSGFVQAVSRLLRSIIRKFERALAQTRSTVLFCLLVTILVLVSPIVAIVYAANKTLSVLAHRNTRRLLKRLYRELRRHLERKSSNPMKAYALMRAPLRNRSGSPIRRLYRYLEDSEAEIMVRQINARADIQAWYCQTAFWPHLNGIKAPRLTCVPDIVPSEFPVPFSSLGDGMFQSFLKIQNTIRTGEHFVTYSNHTKYHTLVNRFRVMPNMVSVIPHGANDLIDLVAVSGSADTEASTDAFCMKMLPSIFSQAVGQSSLTGFSNPDVRFLFYSSQIRPNKNLLSLLRAYNHLLKRRHIGHKLILTGHPDEIPDVRNFVKDNNLDDDVLFLHKLTAQQLAACYRLADLAVNPSLSEGGCPFTLTEALSVGTPVVMSRIPVTEEIVTEPDLQDMMLFDGYDWEDMASRIEWALHNKNLLLERQLQVYRILKQRTWSDVVSDHITILDRISAQPA